MRLIIVALFLIASATAFQASLHPTFAVRQTVAPRIAPLQIIMSDEETEAILKSAADCAEGECSIDDVSEFLAELKDQQKVLEDRLEKIMNMIAHLQHVNQEESRKTDDVRAIVRDMLRVFTSEHGAFFPQGFSGDIGDGPKTAYDALPPKKWTPKA